MRWLRQLCCVWFCDDWLWSATDPATNPNWQSVTSLATLIPQSDQLWLKPRGQSVPRGWYLFTISHLSENHRAIGWMRSGLYGLRQGRPMYPVRNRLRIVHVNRARPLQLELQRVGKPMQIKRLRLIRIPFFRALARMRMRLQRSSLPKPSSDSSTWNAYNRLLHSQASRHALITYLRWQQRVEAPLLEQVYASPSPEAWQFVIQTAPSLRSVEPDQWVVFLRTGTRLSPWALRAVGQQLMSCEQLSMPMIVYGDEDSLASDGVRSNPRFKPAWNRELFWSDPQYSNHWFVRGDIWNECLDKLEKHSWWDTQYALFAHANVASSHKTIVHIPIVLAHCIEYGPDSSAVSLHTSLQSQFPSLNPEVISTNQGFHLQWSTPSSTLVSVIIPTRDHLPLLQACLQSLKTHQAGCDYEVIVVDNGSLEDDTIRFLQEFQCQPGQFVLRDDGPFNYSSLNNQAAALANGTVLLLLNNDVEILTSNWALELASNALRPGIGCVGAQLHYPDTTIQHAGVLLGIGGLASHAHRDYPNQAAGYQCRLQLAQEFSAVTAACLAISRSHWDQLGGLDSAELAVNYNDVDLCLRAKKAGLRNLYIPQVQAVHHESKSRGRPQGKAYKQWKREWAVMQRRWRSFVKNDPAYHPSLTLEDESWNLSLRIPSLKFR